MYVLEGERGPSLFVVGWWIEMRGERQRRHSMHNQHHLDGCLKKWAKGRKKRDCGVDGRHKNAPGGRRGLLFCFLVWLKISGPSFLSTYTYSLLDVEALGCLSHFFILHPSSCIPDIIIPHPSPTHTPANVLSCFLSPPYHHANDAP